MQYPLQPIACNADTGCMYDVNAEACKKNCARRSEAESFRAFRAARWRMEAQSSSLWTSIRANFLIRGREIRSRAFPAVPAIESPRFRKIVSCARRSLGEEEVATVKTETSR